MKTAYLVDQRRRGEGSDPFLEADRRETAKLQAAAKMVHPTLHLHAPPQPATQVAGLFSSSAMPGEATASHTTAAVSSALSGSFPLLATPPAATSYSSLFSTPTTSAPISLFGQSGASPQPSPFGGLAASTPAISGSASLFALTPASGVSNFATPFASGDDEQYDDVVDAWEGDNEE